MSTKLVSMGIKRGKMDSPAETEPASKNDMVHPEMHLDGEHAKMMGAEDLKEGDLVEQTVRWRVKRHSKTTENGKTDYRMTLACDSAGDCKACDDDEAGEEDGIDDGDGGDDSPAMAYITGRAAKD